MLRSVDQSADSTKEINNLENQLSKRNSKYRKKENDFREVVNERDSHILTLTAERDAFRDKLIKEQIERKDLARQLRHLKSNSPRDQRSIIDDKIDERLNSLQRQFSGEDESGIFDIQSISIVI